MRIDPKVARPWWCKVVGGFVLCLLTVGASGQANGQSSLPSAQPPLVAQQIYRVTKSADTNDGACNSDCSLREAIVAANANSGPDRIELPAGTYSLTRTGPNEDGAATGDLDIRDELELVGAGAATTLIDGQQADRILHIDNAPASSSAGGGVLDGLPKVTIRGVTIRNGQATVGGGIYTKGSLTLEQVTIANNQASQNGGGLACVNDQANLRLIESVISHNQAPSDQLFQGAGGGIYLSLCDTLTLSRTTVMANSGHNGAGVYVNDAGFSITQSSLISNSVRQNGGGLFVGAAAGGEIVNSTLSGNQANSSGGGLYIGGDGSATLVNVTIAHNHADQDQTGDGDGGGLASRGFFRLRHTILAGNSDGGGDLAPDCATLLASESQSQGYNLIQESSRCLLTGTLTSNLTGVDPLLGPLQANGGPTLTHLPATSSPVLNLAPAAECAARVDQRGVARPQAANCDSGAVEAEASVGSACDLAVGDEAALRQAVVCLNRAPAGVYTLTLTADISYTQPISPISNLAITRLLIQGDQHTLDAQGHGRALTLVNVPNATLRDLTLTGGKVDSSDPTPNGGGLFLNCSNDQVDAESSCTWTLRNTQVRNNQAEAGGGIAYRCDYHGGGALVVEDSAIRDNQAANAGGGIIYSSDEESGRCSLTLRNTLVEGNSAVEGGGLRILRPRVNLIGSTIRNNRASASGGGVMARISDGFITMTVQSSTISGNQAGERGGGIYIASPDQTFTVDLVNSTVSGNQVLSGTGGGLFLGASFGSLRLALLNSTVAYNRAGQGAGVHIFDQEESGQLTDTLRLNHTLIAANAGGDCANTTAAGGPIPGQQITSGGHNLDSDGSCLTPGVAQASDLSSGTANLGPLADNGGPAPTHALLAGSDALDAGDNAVCAAAPVNGVDQRGVARPQGAQCDIGAYEAPVSNAAPAVFVSSTSSGAVAEVPFRDEDILRYDPSSGNWALFFDGSDVGISDDVDAFAFQEDGNLLLSLSNPVTITGLGLVDDSDIVQFVAATLGVTTTGSFTWYLDGSDVGLAEDYEDIDAIDFAPDGRLLVSTSNNGFSANNVSAGHDEDLFVLNQGSLGSESSGVWELYLDGSAAAISTGRDINGLWVDPANGDLYLSTNGAYTVTGLSGDQNDIFVCTPTGLGAATACSFRLFWDGAAVGFGGERLDGLDIGRTPASFNPALSAVLAAESNPEPQEEAAQDDEESLNPLYLPIIGNSRR